MPTCSPSAHEGERLLTLLQAYDRSDLWLRMYQHYDVTGHLDQVWFDVVDANGVALADRFGRVRSHPLQVRPRRVPVIPGQSVHLRGDEEGVWVYLMPVASDVVLGEFFRGLQGQISA